LSISRSARQRRRPHRRLLRAPRHARPIPIAPAMPPHSPSTLLLLLLLLLLLDLVGEGRQRGKNRPIVLPWRAAAIRAKRASSPEPRELALFPSRTHALALSRARLAGAAIPDPRLDQRPGGRPPPSARSGAIARATTPAAQPRGGARPDYRSRPSALSGAAGPRRAGRDRSLLTVAAGFPTGENGGRAGGGGLATIGARRPRGLSGSGRRRVRGGGALIILPGKRIPDASGHPNFVARVNLPRSVSWPRRLTAPLTDRAPKSPGSSISARMLLWPLGYGERLSSPSSELAHPPDTLAREISCKTRRESRPRLTSF
jgi:hypothetical protein